LVGCVLVIIVATEGSTNNHDYVLSKRRPPNLDGLVLVERPTGDQVLGGMTRDAEHGVGVAFQGLNDFLCLQVPNVNSVIMSRNIIMLIKRSSRK
jgi:hypothetical protein